MLSPMHALANSVSASSLLPHVPELEDLYSIGLRARRGQVIMIAGRSGSQKSGFAMWWVEKMGLDTLYFSADMDRFTASSRLLAMLSGDTTEQIEANLKGEGGEGRVEEYWRLIRESRVRFSFGTITEFKVWNEIEAWVELNDSYPEVIVFDNLMDFEGAESDYAAQMAVMSNVTDMAREMGSTIIITHHASDKSWDRSTKPPSRQEVKGGLSEKPEVAISVSIEPGNNHFRAAIIKQRMGSCDPTANTYAILQAEPEHTRFRRLKH